MYDSVTTWRLYSAEQSVPLGEPLPDLAAARALVRRARRSVWWRDNVEYNPSIRVVLGGRSDDEGWTESFAYPDPTVPGLWIISLHPTMLNDLIVLHELAHCIAPRMIFSGRRRRRGALHSHAMAPDHGAGFAGAMAELVREFGEGVSHDDLRSAYEHFGVPALSLYEYRLAVSDSLLAEADDADMRAESRAMSDAMPTRTPPPGVGPFLSSHGVTAC